MKNIIVQSILKGKKAFLTIIKLIYSHMNMKNVLKRYDELTKAKCVFILVFAVFVGIVVDLTSKNTLPYFYILLFILLFCTFSSYYTTKYIVKSYKSFDKDNLVADKTLFVLLSGNSKRIYSNYIYLPVAVFGLLIPTAAFEMMNIKLDLSVKFFCFCGLSITTMSCTFGAIHYLLFLLFIYKLSKRIWRIKEYNHSVPQKTKWLKSLMQASRICNNFFLSVGLMLILAFCIFTFSGDFEININRWSTKVFLVMFWGIIVIAIILGAICVTIFSQRLINKIIDDLYDIEETSLYNSYRYAKSTIVQVGYAIRISLLNINRYTISHFQNSIFIIIMSIINAAASLEATISLLNIIVDSNVTLLLNRFI